MKVDELLSNPSDWIKTEGPNNKIVMTSRVRLARNLRSFSFPGWAKKPERQKALEAMRPVIEGLSEMTQCLSESMDSLQALDKQILVERHLISREHAARNIGSGIVINDKGTICVMINEEDHLRMQAIKPGLQLSLIHI